MKIKGADLLGLVGLSSRNKKLDTSQPVTLTGAASDPQTGLIVSLASSTSFDRQGRPESIKINYWRHLPYGESRNQNLITISAKPASGRDEVELDEIWVQSSCVYNSKTENACEPEVRKKINRVLEGVSRLNTNLRNKGPVENTAKILNECYFNEVIGENLTIRGLKKKGGFDFSLSPYFTKYGAQGQGLSFTGLDTNTLKTALGFSINTLEPDKDFSGSRHVPASDPASGVTYDAVVDLKETKTSLTMRMHIDLVNVPDPEIRAQAIPELAKLDFKKGKNNAWQLKEAKLLGQQVKITDTKTLLATIGVAQESNKPFARWEYPAFMDSVAEFDLLDMVDPLQPPPLLSQNGGELLYTSLHGCGFENRIEKYGPQIGIADLFLHRGTKDDGSISTVGVAVDFPFASGGPDSNFDGAVPDYMAFWKDIKAFFITHDHFDHSDGLPFYAKAGLMKEKDVYATKEVKYMLEKKMDFLKVPRRLRPKITIVKDETPFAIKDEDGNTRIWVQGSPNATSHSALCTPYIITGCYNDDVYNASVAVYGDGNGLNKEAIEFFKKGTRPLGKMPGVTPEKVDRDITVVLHDPTAIRYEGRAPTMEEVEETLTEVFSWFPDKGALVAPISTNNAEYVVATNVAHNTGRDITAVGRNAELRTSSKNLFGMLHDFNLRDFKLDPFEEAQKKDPLIPKDVLNIYFDFIENLNEECEDLAEDEDREAVIQKKRDKAHQRAMKAIKEKLDPSERAHIKSVRKFMLNSLFKHDAVVFENDYNDYLMYKAIIDRKDTASIRATRTSQLAKDFRVNPGRLMIFTTGTQGNAEERFSTMQKLIDGISLLDVDESVRNTGYKINTDNYFGFIPQPAIPGNENGQANMVNDLVRNIGMPTIVGFMGGFVVHNPGEYKDFILKRLKQQKWNHEIDTEGNIRVYRPVHLHGHGFREDLLDIAKAIPAEFHECHHIPDYDSYMIFRELMEKNGLHHSGIKPDDFQVMKIDANAPTRDEKYEKVAQLNPSYVLVKMARKYGQYFGGWLQLIRSTMLRREGDHRADGLMARTNGDGTYQQKTARQEWEKVSNPNRFRPVHRMRKIGPSRVDRGEGQHRHRSRPRWSTTPPDLDLGAV